LIKATLVTFSFNERQKCPSDLLPLCRIFDACLPARPRRFCIGENTMTDLSRRAVIKATGAAGVSILPVGLAGHEATAQEAATVGTRGAHPTTYLFFNSEEAAFVEAAVARLIPADDKWPGAIEAGVPNYIDKQLNGAWGAGERLYRSGPWQAGTPSQGYQLPFTPAELYRTALGAINAELKAKTPFAKMAAAEQDAYLHSLEAGGKDLGGVPSNVFFATLWECTVEGFFSDPVYGGNRDMLAWRMIGFPGAYASYYDLVDQYGIAIDRTPVSLAADVHGHVHADPTIPAHLP
jgi:gluconate 2-dehydrogenase gamma chain